MMNNGLFEIKDLENAYVKFKSYVYYNNTDINNKIKIAEFEQNISIKLEALLEILNNESSIDKYLKDVKYYLLPKSFERFVESDDCLIISNKNISSEYELSKYNFFIDMPIELHIINVLWILKLGYMLDLDNCEYSEKSLSHCYANRLKLNKENKVVEDKRLFNSYVNQYNSWRDNCISAAEKALENEKNIIIFSLDIKGYYNNIALTFDSVNHDLKKLFETKGESRQYEKYSFLTKYLESIREKYVKEIKTKFHNLFDISKSKFNEHLLPIGALSSNILANWYLYKFDKAVLKDVNPLYYGRYVDDILIVVENNHYCNKECLEDCCKKSLSSNKLIKSHLGYIFSNINEYINFTQQRKEKNDIKIPELKLKTNKNLSIQSEKIKIFAFDANSSKALLIKFKENIRKHSSEFRFLPEDDRIDNDIVQESYAIDYCDSINKLRSIEKYRLDKFKISSFLAKQLSVSKYIQDRNHFKNIKKELMYSFSGRLGLELCVFWYKVLIFIVINNDYEAFLNFIEQTGKSINKIVSSKEDQQMTNDLVSAIKDNLQLLLLNSIKLAISYNFKFVLKDDVLKLDFVNTIKKYFKKDISKNCKKDVQRIISANIIKHNYCFLPIINFLEIKNNNFINFVNPNILNDKQLFSLDFWETPTLDENKVKYSPYNIKYSDIQMFNIYQRIIASNYLSLDLKSEFDKLNHLDNKEESIFKIVKTRNKQECIINRSSNINENFYLEKLAIGIYNLRISEENILNNITQKESLSFKQFKELMKFLNMSIDEYTCNILIFPELSIPLQCLELLQDFSRRKNIAIIGGLKHIINHYRKTYNYMVTILPFKNELNTSDNITILRNKKYFAPSEIGFLNEHKLTIAKTNDKNYLFNWKGLYFACYDCFELADIRYRSQFKGYVDLIIACEWNKDTHYFDKIIESTTRDLHCYVAQVNTSQFGHSKIIAPKSKDEMTMLNITGGKNNILIGNINIADLREFHKLKHIPEKKYNYKPLPPNFPITKRLDNY